MKVKNKTTGNWDQITLGSVTIDNSLGSDSTTHGASVHAVNAGLAGKISGDGSVEKIVRSETAPTGTEATIWIEPSDFNSAETTILKDTLEDEDLDKAPTVHAVKQAIDNVENIDYDSLPVRSKIEYTKENSWDQAPAGYTESTVPYTLEGVGETVDGLSDMMVYPELGKEKIVGVWYNGKPIYRKVFVGNVTNTTDQWVNLQKCNLDNFEEVVRLEGTIRNTKSDRRVLNIHAYETSSYKIAFSYLGQNDYLQCFVTGWTYSAFGFTYIVILDYIKTTDKARSVTVREEASSSSGGAN